MAVAESPRFPRDAAEVVEVDQWWGRNFTTAILRSIGCHRPSSLVAPSGGLVSQLSDGLVRVGFVDEPDIAHEVQLQRRECPRLRVCPPSPDSFPHAAQSARLRSLQLEARACLGDEPFDRRLRANC